MNFEAILVVSANDIWAGGDDLGASQILLEHWDGTAWTQVPAPYAGAGAVTSISGSSADDVWAVASVDDSQLGSALLHWDGSTWSEVATTHAGACSRSYRDLSHRRMGGWEHRTHERPRRHWPLEQQASP